MAKKKFKNHEDELFACLLYAVLLCLLICIIAAIFTHDIIRWISIGIIIYDLMILYILWAISPFFFEEYDFIKYEEVI